MWPHFIDSSIVSILASMGMYTIPYKSVEKFLLVKNSTIISHFQLQIHDFLQQYSIQSDIDNITYNKLTIYRHSPSLTLLIRTQYKKKLTTIVKSRIKCTQLEPKHWGVWAQMVKLPSHLLV